MAVAGRDKQIVLWLRGVNRMNRALNVYYWDQPAALIPRPEACAKALDSIPNGSGFPMFGGQLLNQRDNCSQELFRVQVSSDPGDHPLNSKRTNSSSGNGLCTVRLDVFHPDKPSQAQWNQL